MCCSFEQAETKGQLNTSMYHIAASRRRQLHQPEIPKSRVLITSYHNVIDSLNSEHTN